MGRITKETAPVWRVPNGRRYLTRRGAYSAMARTRMLRDHETDHGGWDGAGIFTPPERCHCSWCSDYGGKVWKRYTRWLMRHD